MVGTLVVNALEGTTLFVWMNKMATVAIVEIRLQFMLLDIVFLFISYSFYEREPTAFVAIQV